MQQEKEQLNVFFTIDKNFIQHFTVTLTSILENNKDLSIRVFVISDLINISDLNKVNKYTKKKYDIVVELLTIDSEYFSKFKVTGHVSKAAYFRLLLAEIIPNDINFGLYIDSDTIVTGSLKYFLRISFEDADNTNLLYAVKEDSFDDVRRLNGLGFAVKQYFNSGVMFINLKAWRNENVTYHLIKIAEEFKKELLWWDQDVLNMFFFNKWSLLPSAYNSMYITRRLGEIPVIIHFNGSTKPWSYTAKHPYKKLYFKYLKLTPYRRYSPLAFAVKKRITGLLER